MIYDYLPWYGAFLEQRSLRVVTPAAEEQITLDEARNHLRLDAYGSPGAHPDDDAIENLYIPAARALCEMISGRAFVPQVFEAAVGQFPCSYAPYSRNGIKLGIGPVRGVTSVIYSDGTQDVTLDPSAYIVDPYADGGYVFPAYGTAWPYGAAFANSVRIRFSAGYDVAGASPLEFVLPAHYKYAMLLMLGHVYENRENTTTLNLAEIPMGVTFALESSSLVNGFA